MHKYLFNFLRRSFAIFTVILVGNAYGQNTSTSAFSSYGIGEIDGIDNATFLGIGNSTITFFDSTTVNYFNPSTYNSYAKGQPLFSMGVSSRISIYRENELENINRTVTLNHFAMGFSFAKHFGIAFGLKPFSRRGYNFSTISQVNFGTDSVKHTYIGSGSASEAFLGISSTLIKYKNHHVSVGGNLGFVFGSVTNERRSNLIGSATGGIEMKSTKVQSLHYEFGLNYKWSISKKHSFIVAGVVTPAQDLRSSERTYLYYSKFVDNVSFYDKLDSTISSIGAIRLAPSSTFGINYNFGFGDVNRKDKIRNSEVSFHISFNISDWSKYYSRFDAVTENPGYLATSRINFGIQYVPEKEFLAQSTKSNFLEIVRYRVGCYQYTLPFSTDGLKQVDSGATFGFGIPIGVQKSLSSINIGFAAGKRGSGVEGTVSENYYGINLGIVFAPGNFERWFVKRKLD